MMWPTSSHVYTVRDLQSAAPEVILCSDETETFSENIKLTRARRDWSEQRSASLSGFPDTSITVNTVRTSFNASQPAFRAFVIGANERLTHKWKREMKQQRSISCRCDALMKTDEELEVRPPSAEAEKDVKNIRSKMSQSNETAAVQNMFNTPFLSLDGSFKIQTDGGVHWDPGHRLDPEPAWTSCLEDCCCTNIQDFQAINLALDAGLILKDRKKSYLLSLQVHQLL